MIFGLVTYTPLSYDQYTYPWQANMIGWLIALSSILCIPGFAIVQIIMTPGTLREVSSRAHCRVTTMSLWLVVIHFILMYLNKTIFIDTCTE